MRPSSKFAIAMIGASLMLSGCTSRDSRAGTAAAQAQAALDQGNILGARVAIQKALGLRDDISDYWVLLAHIDLAANDYSGAFDAYQNVLLLDKGNIEALTRICQLGLAGNAADRAEKFADQLQLLTGNDALALSVKGGAALQRGDKAAASKYIEQVLAKYPNDINAIMLKSRLYAADGKLADAAKMLETSLSQPGDPSTRLRALLGFYRRDGDRANYERTVARLAQAQPQDGDAQLSYADMLFETGKRDAAGAVIRQLMQAHGDNISLAARIVDTWLRQGADAIPADRIASEAADVSLEMKSAYAAYANELGRPDVALAVLGNDQPDAAPNQANSDAKAAFAYAEGLRGAAPAALAKLDAILTVDNSQPRALLARARLRAATGNLDGALEDGRKVLGQNGNDPVARIAVADILLRQGQKDLAERTLREGLDDNPDDPRVAARLAKLLVANGRRADAVAMVDDFARGSPISLRVKRLHDSVA